MLGESPRTSQSDHFMRKAHVTHKLENVWLHWKRHPAPMSTWMVAEYRRFLNHLIVILCQLWLIMGFQICHRQTLLSEKLLKHENPKNNTTQMCAVPLLTQGTDTGGTLSPSIHPLPSHRSTAQNIILHFTMFEATPGRPSKFYFLANHIERTG